MRNFDFSSWQAGLTTVIGLLVATLLMVGIRLVLMQTIQRRRERENRQINERLRTLIAAYKALGSSFTGDLSVDPRHRRELMAAPTEVHVAVHTNADGEGAGDGTEPVVVRLPESAIERRLRKRDAVEAALSDVILLGTEEQVRLAAAAARDMVAGRPVLLAPLVHALRDFIRAALDLDPMPADVHVPDQGPLRPASGGARSAGGGNAGGRNGGGGGGGGGVGLGLGLGAMRRQDEDRA